jgi:imidazolonepropionase-like amidohydrolase
VTAPRWHASICKRYVQKAFSKERKFMADQVFAGTVVLPDRVIEDGYVLVADGLVQRVGSGALPAGEKHGGAGFFVLPGAASSDRKTSSGRRAAPRPAA